MEQNVEQSEEEKLQNYNKNPSISNKERTSPLFSYKPYLFSLAITFVAIIIVFKFPSKDTIKNNSTSQSISDHFKTYQLYGKNTKKGHLKNILFVLDRLGYKNSNETNWDLLWAHDYPFITLSHNLSHLKPHQKINKIPGMGCITRKVQLATSGLEYIPPAFRLPQDREKLLKYVSNNPDVQFVQKSNTHRKIIIKKIADVDLNREGSFIQEFIGNPLLVSGHKFDIGIYVIITSIDPLRVYIYNEDIALRFCPEEYEPFDSNNTKKYVIADEYLPFWEIPAIQYYHKQLGFSAKASLNAYLKSVDKNPKIIYEQIENAITNVILAKQKKIIEATLKRFSTTRHFFELIRFDFIVNEDLKVYLMEANMSPNLSSTHFPQNQLLFEQIIFNLFSLVGVGEKIRKNTLARGSELEERIVVAIKNLVVFPTECNSSLCLNACSTTICKLCKPCLSLEMINVLEDAYREHINKGDCKRIFPPTHSLNVSEINANYDSLGQLSLRNELMYWWFQGKCLSDSSWCN